MINDISIYIKSTVLIDSLWVGVKQLYEEVGCSQLRRLEFPYNLPSIRRTHRPMCVLLLEEELPNINLQFYTLF